MNNLNLHKMYLTVSLNLKKTLNLYFLTFNINKLLTFINEKTNFQTFKLI